MKKTTYAQAVLPAKILKRLKDNTGETSIRYAIIKAAEHYLKCNCTETDLWLEKLDIKKYLDLAGVDRVPANTMFFTEELAVLMAKAEESTVRATIAKVVVHYLECGCIEKK